MQVMTDRESVAANSTVVNVVAGKLHEFLASPSIVRVSATSSAVGLNMSVLVGNESFCQDQEVNAQNRMPIKPDDELVEAAGVAGDRIVVSLRNTTGAAITAFSKVEIIPLPIQTQVNF